MSRPRLLERLRDIRTKCWHITGFEPCCCGQADCPSNGEGWPIWCWAPISRLRWVLSGACREHRKS